MSEHPITEAMLAEKNATGHSIFGPSSSHRWMKCPASLIQGHLAGDRATFFAAEGSVAHWLAEDWLLNGNPYRHVGSIHEKDGFEIEITEEMISYVEEYVAWVSTTPGRHYVEVKVDLSPYTPVPSFGTSDHIFVDAAARQLIVTDLKYGKVVVRAKDNSQGKCYALGAFDELDWLYDFETIKIRIAQPRRDHFDEDVITREELLEFAEELREAAHAAWDPEAPYKPDPGACEYCPARTTCPAFTSKMKAIAQASFDDDDEPVPVDAATAIIDQPTQEIAAITPDLPDYRQVPLETLAAIYDWRPILERWFREAYDYLIQQLELGHEVPGRKLARGRAGNRTFKNPSDARRFLLDKGVDRIDIYEHKMVSPNQASDLLRLVLGISKKKADEMISDYCSQNPGKLTMVASDDIRQEIPDAASAFDD